MISPDWNAPAVAGGVAEWNRGRQPDGMLARWGVPDLSVLPGYSLDDVCYNCMGVLSPGQEERETTSWFGPAACLGLIGAFVAVGLAVSCPPFAAIWLILIGAVGVNEMRDFEEIRAGRVSRADGDIWTEHHWDCESGDHFCVHMDGLRLEITKRAYGALTAGGPYRIYYLPHAKRAVGGQVLRAWQPSLDAAARERDQ